MKTNLDAAVANCDRCGVLMRLAAKRNDKSMPFKLAVVPKGLCANCVVTEFLYNTYPVNMIIDEAKTGPNILLIPHMRDTFAPILTDCDMSIDEINWELVVKNWALPVKTTKSARNCYTMGEAAKRRQAKEEFNQQNDAFENGIADLLGGKDPEKLASILAQARKQRPLIF